MNTDKPATSVEKIINGLSRFTGIVAIGILMAMMLFTVLDVFLRAFFNSPLPGDVEIIEVAMVCTGFLGLAWCATQKMHIKVDLLVSFLPKRLQGIIDSFGYLICLSIYALLAWQGIQEGIANRQMNSLSSTLHFPIFPFYWVMAFGVGVLCLAVLVLLFNSIKKAANP